MFNPSVLDWIFFLFYTSKSTHTILSKKHSLPKLSLKGVQVHYMYVYMSSLMLFSSDRNDSRLLPKKNAHICFMSKGIQTINIWLGSLKARGGCEVETNKKKGKEVLRAKRKRKKTLINYLFSERCWTLWPSVRLMSLRKNHSEITSQN